jgi:hypothetical protein
MSNIINWITQIIYRNRSKVVPIEDIDDPEIITNIIDNQNKQCENIHQNDLENKINIKQKKSVSFNKKANVINE